MFIKPSFQCCCGLSCDIFPGPRQPVSSTVAIGCEGGCVVWIVASSGSQSSSTPAGHLGAPALLNTAVGVGLIIYGELKPWSHWEGLGLCYSPRDCRSSPWRWKSRGSVHWRCKEREDLAWRPPGPSCRPPAWGSWRTGRPGWRGPGRGTREGGRLLLRCWRAPGLRGLAGWRAVGGAAGARLSGAPHCRWATCWSPTLICWGRWRGSCSRTEMRTRS